MPSASLLESRAFVDDADEFGRTPVYWASFNGHVDVARCLLSRGAKSAINEPSKNGDKPLTGACAKGHIEVCELLLKEGADPCYTDNDGYSPLYRACLCSSSEDRLEIVRLLLAKIKGRREKVDKATNAWASTQGDDPVAKVVLEA